jgi:hypothetical protein
VIGLEKRARAAARHFSSCKIEGAQCGLRLSVRRPREEDYAVFGDFEANRAIRRPAQ